jgi:serine/threonine-protein kinase ULK/ATG1
VAHSFGAENLEHRAEIQRLEPSTRISDGDSVLAREYVVIDKGPVEVNALADGGSLSLSRTVENSWGSAELAAQNKRPNVVARRSSRGFLSKPLSTPSAVPPPVLTSSSPTPYPPVSAPAQDLNNPPPFALPPSKASPYGTSPRSRPSHTATTTTALTPAPRAAGYSSSPLAVMVGTPSHAISKVINMASLKLFGNPTDGILLRRPSAKGRKVVPKLTDALDPVEVRFGVR